MARYEDDAPRSRFDEMDAGDEEYSSIPAPRLRRRSRKSEPGGGELTLGVLRDLPHFARLLYGVARDPRVSRVDKGLALAAVAYVVSPIDILPDSIPVIGQIDDIYLVALALGRLLNNAGIEVLLDHWEGDEESLEVVLSLLDRAGSLLPEPLRMLMGRSRG